MRDIVDGIRNGGGTEVVRRGVQIGALLLALASVAHAAQDPRCSYGAYQWSATEVKAGGDQAVVLGAILEGSCSMVADVHVGGRLIGTALPGSTGSATPPSLSDLGTVQAIEGWVLAWKPIKAGFSLAALGGIQRPVQAGQIGLGGSTRTLGAGLRLDYQGAWAVFALVDNYAPSGPGAKAVFSFEAPVLKGVKFLGQGGIGKGGSFFVAGPAIGVGR